MANEQPAIEQLKPQASRLAPEQWLAFRVGEQMYGVEISSVREIVRTPEITPVPQSPPSVAGVMHRRGRIIPVIDLRKRLDCAVTQSSKTRVLVTMLEGKLTGLLVDQASEVLKIAAAEIEPSPKLFGDEEEGFVTGIAKHRDKLVVLLDANKLLRKTSSTAARS